MQEWMTSDGAAGAALLRRRVVLFVALGYACLLLVMTGLLLIVWVAWRSNMPGLAILPAGLLWFLVSALQVRPAEVGGVPVSASEAPALFELIAAVRAAVGAPPVDQVILTAEVNAGVVEAPRAAGLRAHRTLHIGLPLLELLPRRELESVLAHEFAHLKARDSRGRGLAVALATRWSVIALSLQFSRSWAAMLFVPFFRWYAPRLAVLVEAESRTHELRADRTAALHTSEAVTVHSLLRIRLATEYAERVFWPEAWAESARVPSPPADTVRRLTEQLSGCIDHPEAEQWIRLALHERSLEEDSHPATTERLSALGVDAGTHTAARFHDLLRDGAARGGAAALLGSIWTEMAAQLGARWSEQHATQWLQCHADAQLCRAAGRGAAVADRPEAVAWACARWAARCAPADAAIPLLEHAVQRSPWRSEARLLLGELLLRQQGEAALRRGEALLRDLATEEDSHLALTAASLLRRHYAAAGDADACGRFAQRERQLESEAISALRDRGDLRFGDDIRSYPLPAPHLQLLQAQLSAHPEVASAFLVLKRTRRLRHSPVAILAVERRVPWYKPTFSGGEAALEALASELVLPDTLDAVVTRCEPRSRLWRRLKRLPGAELYRAGCEVVAADAPPQGWQRPSLTARSAPGIAATAAVAALVIIGAVVLPGASVTAPDIEERIAELQEWMSTHPGDAAAVLELADLLTWTQRHEEALRAAEQAVALNPRNADAHYLLGWTLMQNDRPADAELQFRAALELAPDHGWATASLGWALRELGRYQDAEQQYRRALTLLPDQGRLLNDLAGVLVELRQREEAEQLLRRAIALEPDVLRHHGNLGVLLRQRGRTEEALAVYRHALNVDPEHWYVWREIGVIEHVQGRHAEAIEALQTAQRLAPEVFENDRVASEMLEASLAGRMYGS